MDPDTNPTFISEYADEDLSTGKVMVQTERRHRVLTVTDLFTIEQDQTLAATTPTPWWTAPWPAPWSW